MRAAIAFSSATMAAISYVLNATVAEGIGQSRSFRHIKCVYIRKVPCIGVLQQLSSLRSMTVQVSIKCILQHKASREVLLSICIMPFNSTSANLISARCYIQLSPSSVHVTQQVNYCQILVCLTAAACCVSHHTVIKLNSKTDVKKYDWQFLFRTEDQICS